MIDTRYPGFILAKVEGTGLLKKPVNPVAAIFFVFEKVAATFRRRKDSCYRCSNLFQQARDVCATTGK
jgi:hypothetical protein